MLVKDGVTANINVGSDRSVVGSTTFDPINGQRQTTASVYRKTGVDVTVTPTINAKGVVLMDVEKRISNAVPDSTGAGGNPDVFERTIKTEVVAASGQTVLLGGLISEDISRRFRYSRNFVSAFAGLAIQNRGRFWNSHRVGNAYHCANPGRPKAVGRTRKSV